MRKKDLDQTKHERLIVCGTLVLSIVFQLAVIYVPFLQKAFSTVSLTTGVWLRCRDCRQFGAVAARVEQVDNAFAWCGVLQAISQFEQCQPR